MNLNLSITKDTISQDINNLIYAFSTGVKQVVTDVGHEFIRETKSNFGESGPFREKPWPKLSDEYAKKVGSFTPTDLRTGELKNSITLGNPHTNYITVSTNCPYAFNVCFNRKTPRNFWPVKLLSPTMTQLLPRSDIEIRNIILKRFNMVSRGTLPIIPFKIKRMLPEQGDIRTSAISNLI
jgi:hypothetical protein